MCNFHLPTPFRCRKRPFSLPRSRKSLSSKLLAILSGSFQVNSPLELYLGSAVLKPVISNLSGRITRRFQKKKIVPMKRELQDLLWSEIALLTFEINAALRNFSDNVQEYDDSVPEILRAVQIHEFPLIVIFPKDGRAGKLVLHMIKHVSFAELGAKHGLTMNGKMRGSLTRVVVNVARWYEFTIGELKPVHESINSSVEKRVPSASLDVALGANGLELIYEAARLKTLISNKSFHSSLIKHILDLYQRVRDRDAGYERLQVDLEESTESVRMLEEGICFAQRNLEACERRVSAQKGQRSKAINRFESTIEALNLEAGSTSAALKKNFGYAQMKFTKGHIRLEKEKNSLSVEKTIVASSAMKLAVFEQLRTSITKLNRLNSIESMRRIMCVVLPLVIPIEAMRKGAVISKASIAELLGFNEKSIIGKHVFERSQTLHTSMLNNLNEVNIFEDAVLPVKR